MMLFLGTPLQLGTVDDCSTAGVLADMRMWKEVVPTPLGALPGLAVQSWAGYPAWFSHLENGTPVSKQQGGRVEAWTQGVQPVLLWRPSPRTPLLRTVTV